MYFRSGLYFAQVKRYLDVFGNKNVKIFLFEEIVKSPVQVFFSICDFFEISTNFKPNFTHENPSIFPRSPSLQYFMRTKFDVVISKLRPHGLQKYIYPLKQRIPEWNKKIGYKPKMASQTERKLRQMYKNDVEKLSLLIGRDLSAWM